MYNNSQSPIMVISGKKAEENVKANQRNLLRIIQRQ